MKQWVILPLLVLVVTFAACNSADSAKKNMQKNIVSAESAFVKDGNVATFDPKVAQTALESYEAYAAAYPDDTLSAQYLFKAGEMYRSLRQFDKAIATYERILKDYNSYSKAPHSLFLMGFTYENDLKDQEKAKQKYEEFMKLYPNHELADDVQFSLANLGKSPDEIIKAFAEKNNLPQGGAKPDAGANKADVKAAENTKQPESATKPAAGTKK
ncbi:hypothetical protein C7N43_30885 [Sphingobacteriales bacterium UPWRP_1]|nr:hypothetical protein BVG80_18770 [Sphingobacteriales bacterium TSM_CSM]PSJ73089.1 hypothetical protein C7N43_30885 [Sphingobacteriales bacterium UPWRP_1]